MPDWIHSLLYIIILAAVTLLVAYFRRDALGLVIGLITGHLIASFLVARLPGFWGDR